jgi:Ca2+-binding EF-hand superfamily protein
MTSISGVGGFRPPPPKPPSFETLDGDSNGSLSLDEFKAGAPKGADSSKSEKLFQAIDSDSDGSITKAESDAFKTEQAKAEQQLQSFLFGLQSQQAEVEPAEAEEDAFASFDSDSDGSVSKDEFLQALSDQKSVSSDLLSKLFDAIDTDVNGSVSRDEQSAFQEALERRGPPPPRSGASLAASQGYGSAAQLGAQGASSSSYSQAA